MNYDFGIAYRKNDDFGVKVTMSEFRGRVYIHIREYIYDGDEEVWIPTKKGYAIDANEVDSIINLLQQASAKLAKEIKPNNQLDFTFEESE